MLSITPVTPAKIMTPEEVEEWEKTHTINETPELKAAKLEWFRHLLKVLDSPATPAPNLGTTMVMLPSVIAICSPPLWGECGKSFPLSREAGVPAPHAAECEFVSNSPDLGV